MADIPAGKEAAYGPPASVLLVIRTYRNREVPETITETTLGQLGIKDSLTRLVLRSLIFLGLLTEAGTTTGKFKALRYATDDDYGKVLGEIITAAYKDVIAIAPPEVSTRLQLTNAFRPYSPASQHDRMVTLFLSLCKEAGMPVAEPTKDSSTRSSRPATAKAKTPARPKPTPPATTPPAPPAAHSTSKLDPIAAALVDALIKQLEAESGVFNETAFDQWVIGFKGTAPLWSSKEKRS